MNGEIANFVRDEICHFCDILIDKIREARDEYGRDWVPRARPGFSDSDDDSGPPYRPVEQPNPEFADVYNVETGTTRQIPYAEYIELIRRVGPPPSLTRM
jgi:hypothetical protein